MKIEFENCTEIEVPKFKFVFQKGFATSLIEFGELIIPNYQSVNGWERLAHERTITNLYFGNNENNIKYSVPYEDEEEGVLGSFNKLEKVAIHSNELVITFG